MVRGTSTARTAGATSTGANGNALRRGFRAIATLAPTKPQDGSKDVFVHATALEHAGIRTLNEGDRVSFELEDDRKGRGKQAGRLQLA
jgi:CspA family cold shock protein